MRLPGTKIWRAFPELDRFSDQQGKAFIKAATSAFWPVHVLRGCLYLVLSCIMLAGVIASAALSEWLMDGSHIPYTVRSIITVSFAVCVALPAFSVVLLFRDLLLRRRIRKVIQSQGVCQHCGYILLGMRVPSDLKLTCPECGDVTTVNPALDTLAPDPASGEARFQGRHDPILPSYFWTRERKRLFNALALIVLLGPPIGFGVWWLYREIDLRMQASRAKELLATTADFRAYYRRVITSRDPQALTGESVYTFAEKMNGLIQVAELVAILEPPDQPGLEDVERILDLYLISNPEDVPNMYPAGTELQQQLSVRDAKRMIELLDQSAGNALAEHFVGIRGRSNAFDYLTDERFSEMFRGSRALSSSNLGLLRELGRLADAQMRLAADRHDRESFRVWLTFGLRNAELCHEQCSLISSLVGSRSSNMVMKQLRRAVSSGLPEPWLDDIANVLRQHTQREVSLKDIMEGERVRSHEMLCVFWSDPRNPKDFQSLKTLFGSMTADGRCGRLMENIAEIDEYHRWLESVTNDHGFQRPYAPYTASGKNLLFVNMHTSSFERCINTIEYQSFDERVVELAVAVELYRARNGVLPESLQQLVPTFINEIPQDPVNFRPISYAKAIAEVSPRGFVLYLWGDSQDDHGTPNKAGQTRGINSFSNLSPGTDYIVFPDLSTQ